MEKRDLKVSRILCPRCGKATNVSIKHLEGVVTFTMRCRSCKEESEVTIKNIR